MTSSSQQRVGIEVEFAGIAFDRASKILASKLGVAPTIVSPHEHEFATDEGSYRLEVDFDLLKRMSRDQHESDETEFLLRAAVEVLDLLASLATPLELVSPPLDVERLDSFNALLDALAEAGAVGTQESIIYAFGVHFNPTAALDAHSITSHLQAFLGLCDWLKARDATDLSREISSFAAPFPEDYERLVLAPNYAPDLTELIDDYLEHNPTRNRALDMLPLFAELDEPRVRAAVADELVNSRPTYHYRLPNSRLGDADWSIQRPWHDWLEVERMAEDPKRLADLCRQRLAHLEIPSLLRPSSDWIEACQNLVDGR